MDKDFERVYLEYYPSVYRYILSLSKNEYMAEEIVQETFFKALKNIERYDSNQSMLTWLCSIGKNTWFSVCKKSKKLTEIPDELPDDKENIIDRIIDSEDSMEILRALHSLEEPYKEVFTLRVLGSLSFSKIGELFAKSDSWARVTFFRAKQRIKEEMKDE